MFDVSRAAKANDCKPCHPHKFDLIRRRESTMFAFSFPILSLRQVMKESGVDFPGEGHQSFLLMIRFHSVLLHNSRERSPYYRGYQCTIYLHSSNLHFLVQPTTLRSADPRFSSSCISDKRASFCFSASLASDALDLAVVVNDCCILRYVSISTSTPIPSS